MSYIQQGDVIFKRISSIPSDAKKKKLAGNIVENGEQTGHIHALVEDAKFEYYENDTKQRFLRILDGGKVTHQEHKTTYLPIGDYLIDIVKEYDHFEEEARKVID